MESFEDLAIQYEPMIHKIIRSLSIYRNKEEFYQLGLIGLWEARKRFNTSKGNFTNYAFTYIKGVLLTEISKSKKRDERNVYAEEEFWDLVEDTHYVDRHEKDLILSYCIHLTENQTKWLTYTCLYDLSVKEIAVRENVSPSAVKNWRAGARAKLKHLITI
ncbi:MULTISPECIES: sigma-70 family RNA polymerase sigma factor [unclassified Bacillus (in: firmicutes)]|uniref:sigma-70 family RNA polymerase sigma factor n=1 Tax=unclassified Bacillus (in: firmicutes) TaxID=185979 RepID=UPI0008EE011E|nr:MULTISPECIES: sigma-70 family RNA polymerase sigma factor [unclassified Bacillus (in: firmicutes)]SFB20539.1 DNA-directed RNA polymerase [Bacillus sp. UNCCL13]SFQ90880.1 DNA-directed RNA polymerase [Bacillus sp. cl95]